MPINAHSHTLRTPPPPNPPKKANYERSSTIHPKQTPPAPHTPHTKQESLQLQLGVTWITLLLSPPQPWECVCSGGKRGWINWRHRAQECDYSGLVVKAATGLCSIPSPHVALCLSWVTAIHRGLLWLSSTELPAWNWTRSSGHYCCSRSTGLNSPCSQFFFMSKGRCWDHQGQTKTGLTSDALYPPSMLLFWDMHRLEMSKTKRKERF